MFECTRPCARSVYIIKLRPASMLSTTRPSGGGNGIALLLRRAPCSMESGVTHIYVSPTSSCYIDDCLASLCVCLLCDLTSPPHSRSKHLLFAHGWLRRCARHLSEPPPTNVFIFIIYHVFDDATSLFSTKNWH